MQRRQALKLFAGLALCPLCASTGFASEGHWSYEGATGPEKWGARRSGCSVLGRRPAVSHRHHRHDPRPAATAQDQLEQAT